MGKSCQRDKQVAVERPVGSELLRVADGLASRLSAQAQLASSKPVALGG